MAVYYYNSPGTWIAYPTWVTAGTTSVSWNPWPDQGTATIGVLSQRAGTLGYAFQQADMTWQSFGYSWPQYPETAAQCADRARRRDEAIREAEAHRAARALVNGRAEALLLGLLDEDQALSYIREGWFEVTGSAGGRFRVNKRGQAGNVDELPAVGGDRIASYCIHPYGGYPDADAHAAQYLALVTDEPGFRRTANRTPRRRLQAA